MSSTFIVSPFARIAYAAAGAVVPVPTRTGRSVGGRAGRVRGPVPQAEVDPSPDATGSDGRRHSSQQAHAPHRPGRRHRLRRLPDALLRPAVGRHRQAT